MSQGRYWKPKEDDILLRRMVLLKGNYRRRVKRILREGVLPGRTWKGALVRFYRLRRRNLVAPRKLEQDKRPLMKVMLLLDKAKDNHEAWDRIFPRALVAVEGVYADIHAARKEMEKMATAARAVRILYDKKMSEDADKFDSEMDECDAALKAEKLVDRQLKRRD